MTESIHIRRITIAFSRSFSLFPSLFLNTISSHIIIINISSVYWFIREKKSYTKSFNLDNNTWFALWTLRIPIKVFFFENYNLLLACQFALTFQSLRDWQSFSQNCSSALNKTKMIFDKSVSIDVQRSCWQQKTDSIKIRQELRAKMNRIFKVFVALRC